jgi:hypothetical protein
LITVGRLPVARNDEVGTIQKLSLIQISTGKIGAIECRLEKICTLQTGT